MTNREVSVFHADHGVSESLISWALAQVGNAPGFFLRTLEIPGVHASPGMFLIIRLA